MTSNQLRKKFLDFFQKKQHTLVFSDTLIPADESLLFTSAGMNQFKPYFLGEKKDISRATSCQKCLRTGDLDNVGKTAYHHTFFEMLGNFSFGDYFKKEAIEFAWEFLTKELKIKEEDLWVSVYKDDEEAYDIWKDRIGIPVDKIVKLGEESNFWPASAPTLGPNGPCGPCSEIFFDRGGSVGCKKPSCNPDCSCGRFVEVWNLVFTQFNRIGKNKLEPLPQKNIDTGMGLERIVSVLQNKKSNFEIDILAPVVKEVNSLVVKSSCPNTQSAINAIADHARAATFAIADGVFPSNEDRGYVIRKIIRKALQHSRLLGNKEPFIYKIPGLLAELMGEQYPEVSQKKDTISKIIRAEEERYFLTVKEGESYLNEFKEELSKLGHNTITGKDVFRFYDTYGVDLDFIKTYVEVNNLKLATKWFDDFTNLLKEQKERSRKKSMFDEDIFKEKEFSIDEETDFIGYEKTEITANILRLFSVKDKLSTKGQERKELKNGEEGLVVTDATPFYAEAGGQLTDKGVIETDTGKFSVSKAFKADNAVLHKGKVIEGIVRKGKAKLMVDEKRRRALARSHTATHLLQASLRKVLGEHVIQQGSLVDEDEFRFDFTHFGKLNNEEKRRIEELVKEFITNGDKVEKKELSLEEAKEKGALAFFKDKYQNIVRVVSVSDYSSELCGGTHVDNTSEIRDFYIESESSISSGIRRIRALVADKAVSARESGKQKERISKDKKDINQLDVGQLASVLAEKIESETKGKIENIKGINFLSYLEKSNLSSSKDQQRVAYRASDIIQEKLGPLFFFLVINMGDKNMFICSSAGIDKGANCKKFIADFGKELSLMGGGNPAIASGVVSNIDSNFFDKVKEALNKFLKQ